MRLPGASRSLRAAQRPLIPAPRSQRRDFSAAVIGGGITGLTSALQLSHDPRCKSITIFEKSPQLGGWLQSERVPVDGGDVLFEYGPRTLRVTVPGALPLLMLIVEVGLFDQLIVTPMNSPASVNRFVYYPDHLVRMPAPEPGLSTFDNIKNFLRTVRNEPLFEGFLSGVLLEHTRPARPPHEWQEDESLASFLSRRFNPNIAENLASSIMHGIYAGDIDRLSAQYIVGHLRNLEDVGVVYGSLLKAFRRQKTDPMDDFLAAHVFHKEENFSEMWKRIRLVLMGSTFTLKGGTQQLIEGLEKALRKSNKVQIKTSTDIDSISQMTDSEAIRIGSRIHDSQLFDHAIAALPAPALAKALTPKKHPNQKVPHETIARLKEHNYATTVMVVNLWYPNPDLLPVEGFGYLIPRSIPAVQNPEFGLGVLFASSSSTGLSPLPPHDIVSQDTAPGTKLTVMLGGHYWDGWKETDYPNHESAVRMARAMLGRHLGITDAPAVARSRLQKDAIPQYTVGHLDRMYSLSDAVRLEFKHRLGLAGNWYNGVGVGDCVRQGVLAATLGTGLRTLKDTTHNPPLTPWHDYNCEDWEFRGGIAMSPIRLVDSSPL